MRGWQFRRGRLRAGDDVGRLDAVRVNPVKHGESGLPAGAFGGGGSGRSAPRERQGSETMPWLTPIVFKQGPDEALTRLQRFGDGPSAVSFRHILHVYRDTAVPVNTRVQAITFETIRHAAQFAAPDYAVSGVAVIYPEDADLIPAGIVIAPPLQRFVTDVASFQVKRPLPLLFDILRSGASAELGDLAPPLPRPFDPPPAAPPATDADGENANRSSAVEYLILTNSDIHVQPAFYRVLGALIHAGYDVITVNRRTVDVSPEERSFSPLFMAERGIDHAGFDCFVFPASMLDRFAPSDSCCGAGHVMRSLLFNLVAHAHRFLMLTHAHMTYHLGDDKYWCDPAFADYEAFNMAQARSVIEALSRDVEKARRLSDFIAAHEMGVYRKAPKKRKWYWLR